MKLQKLSLDRLQYVEAGQFIVRSLKDIADLKQDTDKDDNLTNYINDLRQQSDLFNLALQEFAGHIETAELIALDLLRDRSIITLRRQIAVYEHNQDQEIKLVYARAHKIMRDYRSLERDSYEAENLGIQNLLTTWARPENKNIIEALKLQSLLEELSKMAAAFEEKFAARSHDTIVKLTYDTKAIKDKALNTYRDLAGYVLAMAKPKNAQAMYISLLDAINNGRRYFSDLIARREGSAHPEEGSNGQS